MLAKVLKALGQKTPNIGNIGTNGVLDISVELGANLEEQNECRCLCWIPLSDRNEKKMEREYIKYLKYKDGIENAEE